MISIDQIDRFCNDNISIFFAIADKIKNCHSLVITNK